MRRYANNIDTGKHRTRIYRIYGYNVYMETVTVINTLIWEWIVRFSRYRGNQNGSPQRRYIEFSPQNIIPVQSINIHALLRASRRIDNVTRYYVDLLHVA